mmetsp:Transcript_8629/g.15601  ORF Transcript_8629/g.15601 Transcript_8629/m.15601 type:complete len:119 (-) Transcript_8629:1168-1524(-)
MLIFWLLRRRALREELVGKLNSVRLVFIEQHKIFQDEHFNHASITHNAAHVDQSSRQNQHRILRCSAAVIFDSHKIMYVQRVLSIAHFFSGLRRRMSLDLLFLITFLVSLCCILFEAL